MSRVPGHYPTTTDEDLIAKFDEQLRTAIETLTSIEETFKSIDKDHELLSNEEHELEK